MVTKGEEPSKETYCHWFQNGFDDPFFFSIRVPLVARYQLKKPGQVVNNPTALGLATLEYRTWLDMVLTFTWH